MIMGIDFPIPDVQQQINEVSIINEKLNTHVGCLDFAKKVRDRAKVYAAVDTGHMRDSIRCWETNEGATVTAGGVSNSASLVDGDTSSVDVDYAVYQEFGTYKMRAHPYMRPAIDEVSRSRVFLDSIADKLSGA